MEAHVHVVFPQDPITYAGRHGRGAYVFGSAARRIKVVWKGHGRAEELGEASRRARAGASGGFNRRAAAMPTSIRDRILREHDVDVRLHAWLAARDP